LNFGYYYVVLFTHLHKFSMFDLHRQKNECNVDSIIFMVLSSR